MTDLAERQFQVGDVVFGEGTTIVNTAFTMSEPASTNGDQAMPGEDGVMMGRDYLQGRTLSWELTINRETAAAGQADWRALEGAWDATETRLSPGAVMPVRLRVPGGSTVVAYGRPRKIAPSDTTLMPVGRIGITADFSTADRRFYDDIEQEVSFGIQPTIGIGGGITWPITWPITWASADTSNESVVVNGGDAPTWPVITFTGPIVNPTFVLGSNEHILQLVTTIAENQSVVIDTRPWVRSVVRDDGGSLAGTIRGSRLADFVLQPGTTAVAVQGVDLDGTAGGRIRWRNAYTTP
jgi:hypothetical protein